MIISLLKQSAIYFVTFSVLYIYQQKTNDIIIIKVWETSMPTVIEHNVGQDDANSSFGASFGPDPNSLDPTGPFSKGTDTPDDNHEGYSPSPNQVASNSTTNVCKVNSYYTIFVISFLS